MMKFNKLSLKKIIALFILVFTIIPSFIITVMMYRNIINVVRGEYMENYVNSIFYGIDENFSNMMEGITTTALNTISHVPLYHTLVDDSMSVPEKEQIVFDELKNILENDRIIDAADIILKNGEVYRYTKESVQGLALCDTEFLRGISHGSIEMYPGNIYDLRGNSYCAVILNYNNYMNINDLGVLVLYVNTDKIVSFYDTVSNNEALVFVSIDDIILLHKNPQYLGKHNSEIISELDAVHTYRSYQSKIPAFRNKIKINMIVYNNIMYDVENEINVYIVILFIITVIFSVFVSFLIAGRLSSKIVALVKGMKQFSRDKDNFMGVEEENEFFVLEQQFNKMAVEIKTLIHQNEIESEKKRIAELSALQSQINPHFLYNVIDSIKWMAKLKKPYEDIEQITYLLSRFFRISLHNGREYIKVKEEIEHVMCYIKIENIRHKDMIEVKFDVDEEILNEDILKIILQPLVENSIKHGFKNMKNKGIINITGRRNSNGLIFCVTDNGCGFDFEGGKLPKSLGSGGYGLRNVYERIKIAYGAESNLEITSQIGKGTTVTININKQRKEADDE